MPGKSTKTVFIEISGKCQAKCPLCAQERLKKNSYFGGTLKASEFSKILNHLFKIKILKNECYDIPLFNWGEPFLNSEIDEILDILGSRNLKAAISSNFIKKQDISNENLKNIGTIIFSLSGFTQKSYEKIHGASLKKVLNNFKGFLNKLRKYSYTSKVTISWHRYRFNESELLNVQKYCEKEEIIFNPSLAYLNDGLPFLELIENDFKDASKNKILRYLLIEDLKRSINYHKKLSLSFSCPAWDEVVISETGKLLLCCGITGYDKDYVLGDILKMSNVEIWEKKRSSPLCKRCIGLGASRFAYSKPVSESDI